VATVAVFFTNSSLSSPFLCFASNEIVQVHLIYGLWADGQHLWGTWQYLWWNSPLLCYDAVEAPSVWSNDDRHIYEASLLSSPLYSTLWAANAWVYLLVDLVVLYLTCDFLRPKTVAWTVFLSLLSINAKFLSKCCLYARKGNLKSLCYFKCANLNIFSLPKKCHDSRLVFSVCSTSAGSCLGWCTWCNGNIKIYSKYLNIGLPCV
jgi:hypothetical protein